MITLANIRRAIYCINKRLDLLEGGGISGGNNSIQELQNKVSTLESLISEGNNPTQAIDKFNEIVAFLDSIKNTETLSGIIRAIQQDIGSIQNSLPTVMGGSGSGHKSGLVPDPGATAGTTKYLREDGTWTVPSDNTTPESIGFGYGVCSIAGTTAAKEVSISNFILTKYGIVTVFFTNAILSQNSTLNVNSTGAKAIKLYGSQLNPDVVRARTTVVLQYDGTDWNIISMSEDESNQPDSALWVDMGLPSGVKWAKKFIDVTQQDGFAASEYQYECSYFSWGNIDAHNPTGANKFNPWTWGGVNSSSPYFNGQVYGETMGCKLTADTSLSHDAARANLGSPWRVPTKDEFVELFDNCDFVDSEDNIIESTVANKLITMNSVVGIRLKSKVNGNFLFFACTGQGSGYDLGQVGTSVYCWSSTYIDEKFAYFLRAHSGGYNEQNYATKSYAMTIRPVI